MTRSELLHGDGLCQCKSAFAQRFFDNNQARDKSSGQISRYRSSVTDDLIWRLRWGLPRLVGWLKAPEQTGLRRAFAVWLGRVFLPKRLPGVSMPPLCDLTEIYAMLAGNAETWADQLKHEGREQELEQGSREATRHLLTHQDRRHFGPAIAEQTERLLAGISNLQQLEEFGDQLAQPGW